MQRIKITAFLTCAVCSLALLAGCSKKEQASAPTNPTASAPAVDPAAQAAAEKAPPAATALPASDQAAIAEAQAAMKAKNYDRAVQAMVNLQTPTKQPMTPQQAAAVANQMRQFQRDLGGAVASGDPAAIAAAQKLRASTPH